MNQITRRYYTAEATAVVSAKLRDLAVRATKKGISTDLTWSVKRDDEDSNESYVLTVEFSDLVRLAGGWQLVAVADASATDQPLIFKFDDNAHIDGEVDMMRCDHCGRRTQRNKVLFVKNDAGDTKQVGGSCSKDFLGHDPFWMTSFIEAVDSDTDARSFSGELDFDTEVVISAAISATRIGFRKSDESMSTRKIMEAMLSGRFYSDKAYEEDHRQWKNSPASTVTARQVLDWMLEQEGTFGDNMRRIAESRTVGAKWFGFIAYAPTGLITHQQEAQARKIEEQVKAEALPVPLGKVIIEGQVAKIKTIYNDYGSTDKMRVVSDDGWAVWGSIPKSISGTLVEDEDHWNGCYFENAVEVGDRVRFVATIEASDDPAFGFFKRPTKAEIIEQAVVS